ncbi:MAG: FGGY-family carbohydrate kinase, partial [Kangiellaceae bacterium]|nr:FGGY-family carbohydrate kinase [Kangiellaceae bacterium]
MNQPTKLKSPESGQFTADKKTLHSDDLILTIDNGTQSVRALIFDLQGQLIAKSKVEIEPYFSEKPGWAEQHADYFWQMVSKACQNLWAQDDVTQNKLQDRIVAFSVTTQRNSVVNLDHQGKPLRPAILWLDQRLAEQPKSVPWYWRLLFRIAGQTKVINYFQRKAQANWIVEKQPEVWRNTNKFLLLSGYLTYKLTGQYIDSVANIVGYLPLDYKKQQWAGAFDWRWRAMPITKDMLPQLVKPGDKIGEITEAAAQATGIKTGTPMIAAASDKACEVLGSGCFEPSTASLSYGTTATININTRHYVEPLPFIPPYPSAIPGYYNSEVMIYRGFWMVSWFKQQFGLSEVLAADKQGMPAEALFDELVNQVPPGSMGLMLQPYWSPGIKNLEAKGAVIGFGDVHTRAHLYRSILEGLCYALREGKEKLE